MDESQLDRRIDGLFGLPPEEFTKARNELATALRSEGQRDEAASVGSLRRPTIAAWAVNQAVRRQRDAVGRLLEAGQEVQRAQRRALSGLRTSGLREATRSRRALIDELTERALATLVERGANPEAHRSAIAATFDAASADDAAGESVLAARLSQTLPAPSGFASMDALAVVAPVAGDEPAEAPPADREQQERAMRRRAAIRAVDEARRRFEEARSDMLRAREELRSRARLAEEAADAAAAAESEAVRLRSEAERLAADLRRSRDRVEEVERDTQRRADELDARERELGEIG